MSPNPKIVIVIVGAIILAVSFRQDFLKTRKITTYKIFLALLFILLVVYGIIDVLEGSESSRKITKSINDTTKKIGKNVSQKVDNGNRKTGDTLTVIHTDLNRGFKGIKTPSRELKFALVSFALANSINDTSSLFIKNITADSVELEFHLSNYGNSEAFDLNGHIIPISFHKGLVNLTRASPSNGLNHSSHLLPVKNSYIALFCPLKINRSGKDSSFFYINIAYKDSTKSRKYFNEILYVNPKNLRLAPALPKDYDKIKTTLIKNKLWRPPFR